MSDDNTQGAFAGSAANASGVSTSPGNDLRGEKGPSPIQVDTPEIELVAAATGDKRPAQHDKRSKMSTRSDVWSFFKTIAVSGKELAFCKVTSCTKKDGYVYGSTTSPLIAHMGTKKLPSGIKVIPRQSDATRWSNT